MWLSGSVIESVATPPARRAPLARTLMPEALKRAVVQILHQPAHTLRYGGLISAAIGVAVIWLVRR